EGLREGEEQGGGGGIEDGLNVGKREEVSPREEEHHDHYQEEKDRPVSSEYRHSGGSARQALARQGVICHSLFPRSPDQCSVCARLCSMEGPALRPALDVKRRVYFL